MIGRMLKNMIEMLFPRLCLGCMQKSIEKDQILCITCLAEIPFTDHFENPENKVVEHFYGRIPIVHGAALLYFGKNSRVQHLLHNFKYKGETMIGKRLGVALGRKIKDCKLFPPLDLIIPVPIHKNKRKRRGFNQTEIIAEGIQSELKIPYHPSILIKVLDTETQTNKNRNQRQINVKDSVQLANENLIKGKNILLVDDVITTGATAEVNGRILLDHGAKSISVVTAGAATTSFL